MFSKVNPKATIIGIIVFAIVALVTNLLPPLGFVLCFFATIPGVVLWHKYKESFGIVALVSVIITTLFGNVITLSAMVVVLITGWVIGQLLKERATKERIFYVTTTYLSLFTLIAILILQVTHRFPKGQDLVQPLRTMLDLPTTLSDKELSTSVLDQYNQVIDVATNQFLMEFPSHIIVSIFIIVLLNLLITFPILRKFKVATPVFKPLYAWQMPRFLLFIYVIAIVCTMFTSVSEPSTFQSIVLNFKVVLSLCMYIQGLSVIHFFGKSKAMPLAIIILLMVIGSLISLIAPIIILIGMVDLLMNLKAIIKK
ncbi:DUF2232 domain-containing protein [Staphylococcus sp. SQ8-PEA]|uniref:DUF2232 domain-containing protein n=1 Tax=Staphylococcus marylandisciuri TaxID=2981529 RepID=A0ABT2QR69_9STAP|nr:DUF2232 domain-containing protein [Staphylococcus marylandisciuri]MCU5746447.1 DUF2232 domain-containing protein [Staphylococcus marylandisciuri]